MDILAARTFLAVVETGSFVGAGRLIHASQSTISARIKALEDLLGKQVFVRSKAGCEMTAAGAQFLRYAQTLVRVWEEARHQVAVPPTFDESILIGGQYSLWHGLLISWLREFRRRSPRVAVRGEIGTPQRLMRELGEGALDLAVMYRPEHRHGLVVRELFEDRLVLVSAAPETPLAENYIFFDWGEAFLTSHADALPDLHNPGLTLDLGAIGVDVLLDQKGAGYFPERIAAPYLESKQLARIDDAPSFSYPAYLVYRDGFASKETMALAIALLDEIAGAR